MASFLCRGLAPVCDARVCRISRRPSDSVLLGLCFRAEGESEWIEKRKEWMHRIRRYSGKAPLHPLIRPAVLYPPGLWALGPLRYGGAPACVIPTPNVQNVPPKNLWCDAPLVGGDPQANQGLKREKAGSFASRWCKRKECYPAQECWCLEST